jgi:hypothetical protein
MLNSRVDLTAAVDSNLTHVVSDLAINILKLSRCG